MNLLKSATLMLAAGIAAGAALFTLPLGGGTAPLNCRILVLLPEGDSFVTVHLHGPMPAVKQGVPASRQPPAQ